MPRILTPDVQPFLVAVAVVYSVCSFSIASWVHVSVFKARTDFFLIYPAVLGLTVIAGMSAFGARDVLGDTTPHPAWMVAGVPLGVVATRLDRVLVRRLTRTTARRRSASRRPWESGRSDPLRRTTGGDGRSRRPRADPSADSLIRTLGVLATTAVLEEVIYRGTLLHAASRLPGQVFPAVAIGAIPLAFALSHVHFGWAHVAGKFPLGLIALVATLASGTIVPAISTHLTFNVLVWDELRRSPERPPSASENSWTTPAAVPARPTRSP